MRELGIDPRAKGEARILDAGSNAMRPLGQPAFLIGPRALSTTAEHHKAARRGRGIEALLEAD